MHMGCQLAQGYGVARPMPADKFPDWVDQWHQQAAWQGLENRYSGNEDITLVVAERGHRNWIEHIVGFINSPADNVPITLDSAHCRFGRWYRGSGAARYGDFIEFQEIAPLHEAVHIIATGLVALARDGQVSAAHEDLPRLFEARDLLIVQIKRVTRVVSATRS